MIKVLILLLPMLIFAESLKELIELASKNNEIVISKEYIRMSQQKELDSKNSSYFPTIDIGALYKRDDEGSPFQAGDTYNAYAKLSLNIYDGGKKSSDIKLAKSLLKSSSFDKESYKKNLALQITEDFFNIKSLYATLNAKHEAQERLKAQLQRIQKFYDVKMATKDNIDRVQADFDTNIYKMEAIKFQILSLKSALELKVGQEIDKLDDSEFKKSLSKSSISYDVLDSVKSLLHKKDSLKYASEAIDSFNRPIVNLQDTYNTYEFSRLDPNLIKLGASPLHAQNTLVLSINYRLLDYGVTNERKEAMLLNAKAIEYQINFQTKAQSLQLKLALSRIQTSMSKIQSAQSAFDAASSAFNTIEKKYNARIVDYIVYLDSLTKKTDSKALYESSLYELEIAYATYYFYNAKNILEEIK